MKWTMRKGGHVMGTFRVRVHVPKEMVDFIQAHTDWSQKAAIDWIRQHYHDLAEGYDALMIAYEEPEIVDEKEVETSVSDGHLLYEGPNIITST